MGSDAKLNYDRELLLERISTMESQIENLHDELTLSNRLASLGVLSGMIAHEVNNLLTPILSYAQLALKDPDDPALVEKALTRVVGGTEQVASIAASILGFLKEDQQFATSDVGRVLDETMLCLGRNPQKSGVVVERHIEPHTRVSMSPICLQQVLLNLLLNAFNAMDAPGGTVEVATERIDEGNRVLIRVRDSGRGIDDEFLNEAFEPLRTGSETGNGLGLSVCRRLVEEAGGRMSLRSKVGQGTTVSIELGAVVTA